MVPNNNIKFSQKKKKKQYSHMKMKPQIWQRCAFGGGLYSTPRTWLSKVTPCPGCHSVASTFSRRNVLEEHNRKHDCSICNHLFVVGRSFTIVVKAEFPATVTAARGRKSLKRKCILFSLWKAFPSQRTVKIVGFGSYFLLTCQCL